MQSFQVKFNKICKIDTWYKQTTSKKQEVWCGCTYLIRNTSLKINTYKLIQYGTIITKEPLNKINDLGLNIWGITYEYGKYIGNKISIEKSISSCLTYAFPWNNILC